MYPQGALALMASFVEDLHVLDSPHPRLHVLPLGLTHPAEDAHQHLSAAADHRVDEPQLVGGARAQEIEVGPLRRLQDVCRVERRPSAPVHLGRLLPLGQSPGELRGRDGHVQRPPIDVHRDQVSVADGGQRTAHRALLIVAGFALAGRPAGAGRAHRAGRALWLRTRNATIYDRIGTTADGIEVEQI